MRKLLLVSVVFAFAASASAQTVGPNPTNPFDYQFPAPPGTTVRPDTITGPTPTPTTPTPGTPVGPSPGAIPTNPTPRVVIVPGSRPSAVVEPVQTLHGFPDALRAQPGGLTADRAVQRALAGPSPAAQVARANAEIYEAARAEALRSMIPTLSTSFRYTRLSPYPNLAPLPFFNPSACFQNFDTCRQNPNVSPYSVSVALVNPNLVNQYDWRTTLTIPLTDIPLRLYPTYRAASINAEAYALQLEGAREQVALEARLAFLEYLRALGQAFLIDQQVDTSVRHRADVSTAVAAGTLARADLLNVEAQLADAQRNALLAHNQVDVADALLRQRLHLRGDEPIVVGESIETELVAPANAEAMIVRMNRQRPELLALEQSIRAVDQNVFATRMGQLPSVTVVGNFDYLNPNPRIFPQVANWDNTWDLTVQASWSPTQAFVADATVRRLHAQQALLDAQRQQLREATEMQIRNLVVAARAALAGIEATRSALASAEEGLRVRRERVAAGAAVITDLLDAELAVLRQRLTLINATIDFREALANLDRQVGHRVPSSPPARGE